MPRDPRGLMPTTAEICFKFITLGILLSPSYCLNVVLGLGSDGNKPYATSGMRDLLGEEEG
jgi:hypothetical protein